MIRSKDEDRFAQKVGQLFEMEKRDAKNSVKKSLNKDQMNPIDTQKWLRAFIDASTPLYFAMMQDGGNLGAKEVSKKTARPATFNVRNPIVLNQTAKMATKFARLVNDTTKDELRKSLIDGVALGESEAKLADRVDDVFGKRINNAMTIARTETTKAINSGQVESYKQNGIKKKQWLTVLDERTRQAHSDADGPVFGIDDDFNVGGESLPMPGVGGSAGNTINCRCRSVPIIT